MRAILWLSGFFLGLAFALALFVLTGFTPTSSSWGGVISSGFIGGLLFLAGRKQ